MSSTDTVDDGQSDSWDAAESSGNSDAIPSDATPSDASLDADAPIDGSPAPWVLTISPATLLVEADAPPFDGGFYPSSLGDSDVTGVTVGPTSFTGAVELSVTGLPSSSTAAFIGSPVQAAFWANLNVTVSSATPLGSYVLTVLGKSSGMSQTATVTLVVASAQPCRSEGDAGASDCGAGSLCVKYQAVGGFLIPPDDAGRCPPGMLVAPEFLGACSPAPGYACQAIPSTCASTVSCSCAASSLCETSGFRVCSGMESALLTCVEQRI
jgi:hypothetical protein